MIETDLNGLRELVEHMEEGQILVVQREESTNEE